MTDQTCDVEYTKFGTIHDPAQVDALLTACDDASSLLVLTHGWNNDMKDARQLYDELLASLRRVAATEPQILQEATVLQVFWPSKKFAAEELISGGAASLSERDVLQQSLQALQHDPYLLGIPPQNRQNPSGRMTSTTPWS